MLIHNDTTLIKMVGGITDQFSRNKNVSSVHECPTRTFIFYVQWTVKLG